MLGLAAAEVCVDMEKQQQQSWPVSLSHHLPVTPGCVETQDTSALRTHSSLH